MRRLARIDVDAARRLVVWEAMGEGNGRPEGEAGLDEWAGWPLAKETGEGE